MVKSIFELERRFDFNKEFIRLINLLDVRIYGNKNYRNQTFWAIADINFSEWRYRLTATNISQYFEDLDIDFNNISSCDNTHKMYVLQFIDSYIVFLIYNFKIDYCIDLERQVYKPYLTVLKNIGHIISKLNFKRDIDKQNGTVTYIKRDADTDSILSIIENEDDLRLALLEYNDFRIENDINEKRIILKKLGDYLEPKRKEFNSINKSLTDDIFYMLNKFYIRHNNDGNIKFDSNGDYIKWYDKLFKMIIHLIRSKYIFDVQKELKDYKK